MSDQLDKKPYLPLAFGRMPGWAISLTVALVATCIAVLAIANVNRQARSHRVDEYQNCVKSVQSSILVIDVFGKLRDADLATLDVTSSSAINQPTTPAGRALVAAVQKRVAAYDELLFLAAKGQKLDCNSLK